MRILALDYGEKTIGVSVSDELCKVAFGLEIIRRPDEKSIKKSIARLKEIIDEYDIKEIVLGFPKNMDNSNSDRCEKTIEFKERLERNFKKIIIHLWDERLSTVASLRSLHSFGLKRHEVDSCIDKMAAVYILQGYLEYINKSKK